MNIPMSARFRTTLALSHRGTSAAQEPAHHEQAAAFVRTRLADAMATHSTCPQRRAPGKPASLVAADKHCTRLAADRKRSATALAVPSVVAYQHPAAASSEAHMLYSRLVVNVVTVSSGRRARALSAVVDNAASKSPYDVQAVRDDRMAVYGWDGTLPLHSRHSREAHGGRCLLVPSDVRVVCVRG